MQDLAINVIARPLIVLAFFLLVAGLAFLLRPLFREGRTKTFLYQRRELGDKWVFLMSLIWIAVIGIIIWWYYRDF